MSDLNHTYELMKIISTVNSTQHQQKPHSSQLYNGAFSKIYHILIYKNASANRNNKNSPMYRTAHNAVKLEINDKRNHRNYENTD